MAFKIVHVLLDVLVVFLPLILDCNGSVDVLKVSLYKVTKDTALIDWHISLEHDDLDYCEFVYAPLSDKEHQQISSHLSLIHSTIFLKELLCNVTYSFHMLCYDKQNKTFVSNTLQFTTGSEQDEPVNHVMSSNANAQREITVLYPENPYPVSLDAERMHSSNVFLGAVCGIIGFLIINVTVVLAVRKYSHWRMRRRRIMELEDRDYDGLEFLHDDMD